MPTLCLKDPQIGNGKTSDGVVCWNKLHVCWRFKDWKNSQLTINNYLLKHNGVTMIYTIYISREKLSLLQCLRGRQLRYSAGAVFLSNTIFRRVRVLLERL